MQRDPVTVLPSAEQAEQRTERRSQVIRGTHQRVDACINLDGPEISGESLWQTCDQITLSRESLTRHRTPRVEIALAQLTDQEVLLPCNGADEYVAGSPQVVRRQGLVVPAKFQVLDNAHPVLSHGPPIAPEGCV